MSCIGAHPNTTPDVSTASSAPMSTSSAETARLGCSGGGGATLSKRSYCRSPSRSSLDRILNARCSGDGIPVL
jgi:hypothetical protein